ncbi:RNA polymerase [Streptomyces carminius]|uniref:RNA polymerase n=1 Tax=Streptomyces carminius TaxID=2665496 RepID=A0A2M8LU54_9ACTN|nr:sigma-70 family RNA polymerase sigma factor [Streptomyces carminius]PJE95491.1 RNA polymerase [Streptomyces carminius]
MRRSTEAGRGTVTRGRAHPPTRPPHADCEEFVRDLYARHGTLLLRYAARLLGGDWHKAEDILQETAARAWRHSAVLDGDAREARPWLFTVVRNLVIDHHRSCRLRPVEFMALEELDATVEDGMDRALTSQVVTEALQDLSGQHREVIRLMYYLEYSVAQTAEYLGIPPGTVKSRTYYAMRALRRALRERGLPEG